MIFFKSILNLKEKSQEVIFEKTINSFSVLENHKIQHEKMFFEEHFSANVNQIAIFKYNNVIVSNTIIYKGLSYSEKSSFHSLNNNFISFSNYFKSLLKGLFKRKIFFKNAFLGGQEWGDNFYHFTLELLPNLVNFHTHYPDIPILMPSAYKSKSFITGYLSIVGIKPTYYNVNNVLKVENLFSSEVPRVGVFNKFNILNLKKKIEIEALSISYTKPFRNVYLSRSKANRRRVSNEPELVNMLSKFGFEIYYAEDLELSSLIRILSETKFLISNHGAGLSNILHLQPKQTILELKAENDNYWMYFSLSRILDHNYYYLFAKGDSSNYRDSNIDVDIIQLESLIKDLV
jgi:hypothetical protein